MKDSHFPSILIAVCALLLASCVRHQDASARPSQLPFSFTNAPMGDNSSEWIVQYTNGISLAIGQRRCTLYLHPDSTITIDFDPAAVRASKIILETPSSENAPGEWVTDVNGDGIPEMRRIKGRDGSDLFYGGGWFRSEPNGNKSAVITFDGKRLIVSYDGKRWVERKEH